MGNLHLLNGTQSGLATGIMSIDFNEGGVTNQFVRTTNNAAFDLTNNFTIMVWAKGAVPTGGAQETILAKADNSGSQYSWQIRKNLNTAVPGVFEVVITGDGNIGGTQIKDYASTNNAFGTGGWHLMGFTFSSGTLQLFLDGNPETARIVIDNTVSTVFNSTTDFTMATRLSSGAQNAVVVATKIYGPAIWNTVLSNNAIKAVYNNGTPLNLTVNQGNYNNAANLALYYKMAVPPDTTSSLTDLSGNNNSGTVNNVSAFSSDVP